MTTMRIVRSNMRMRHSWPGIAIVAALLVGVLPDVIWAHGVTGKDAVFLQGLQGQAIGPLMYLGAKHMVTGYDTCCSWSASSSFCTG